VCWRRSDAPPRRNRAPDQQVRPLRRACRARFTRSFSSTNAALMFAASAAGGNGQDQAKPPTTDARREWSVLGALPDPGALTSAPPASWARRSEVAPRELVAPPTNAVA